MKNRIFVILFVLGFILSYGQKNFIDQPYLEINVTVDTVVIPDLIYLNIHLKESDSKNKKSIEEMEIDLVKVLSNLNINLDKDLSIVDISSNFKTYFLKGQNLLKSKLFNLLVYDANTASKVILELEKIGISNVNVEKTEYSKTKEMELILKQRAIEKSKVDAEKLLQPFQQNLGKVLYLGDSNKVVETLQGQINGVVIRGVSSLYGNRGYESSIIKSEFNKIKMEAQIQVKYAIVN